MEVLGQRRDLLGDHGDHQITHASGSQSVEVGIVLVAFGKTSIFSWQGPEKQGLGTLGLTGSTALVMSRHEMQVPGQLPDGLWVISMGGLQLTLVIESTADHRSCQDGISTDRLRFDDIIFELLGVGREGVSVSGDIRLLIIVAKFNQYEISFLKLPKHLLPAAFVPETF